MATAIFYVMPRELVAPAAPAWRWATLGAGPAAFLLLALVAPETLTPPARIVLGLAAWMAIWWLTEPVPLAATSLLPIALLPALGAVPARNVVAPYANEIVFLFLAGFLLAAALESWRAHARIAYSLIAAIGIGPRRATFAVMLATATISVWISNTATAAMMYPIALAIGALFGSGRESDRARTALMLGVAYAASIGGMGSLIGTPPNLIFAGAARELAGRPVGFGEFLLIGLPFVLVLLPLCWAMLVFVLFRSSARPIGDAGAVIRDERAKLGPVSAGERWTVVVFALTALGWILRERKDMGAFVVPGLVDVLPGITDASIGVAGAILLFVVQGSDREGRRRPLLTWSEARGIPWDVLLLFGGGLSLAAAMESTGLAQWFGSGLLRLDGAPTIAIYAGLALVVLLLSELASNTAIAAMAMPIAAAMGPAIGEPALALMLVTTFASSTGFALPVATPPNSIVFGSGQVSVRDMARAGVLLDIIAIAVIVAGVRVLYPLLF